MAHGSSIQPQTSSGLPLSRWSGIRTSFFWLFAIALLFRLALIIIGHTYRFKADDNAFGFGWEMGRIGRAIALGRGFADPFDGRTGSTAWEPPLYPYLIAGVFRLTGIYTQASAFILLALNSIFSSLTCIPIFLIARRCFSEKVAIWSAWIWALLPWVTYWCTRWVWETSLAALLLTLIFWLTLRMEETRGVLPWIAFGVLWGVAGLTNTSLLAFLPASGLWALYKQRSRVAIGGAVLSALFFGATIAPWMVRNYEVFGKVIFIRSNFGAELRLGNGPGADGTWMSYVHPSKNIVEFRRYQALGEIAYIAERKREATAYIRHDWPHFGALSLKRFVYYWNGLPKTSANPALAPFVNSVFLASSVLAFWGLGRALSRHRPAAWLFLWLILTYPSVYYFVYPHPRYRHPIEPELLILIVYLISEAHMRRRRATPQSTLTSST